MGSRVSVVEKRVDEAHQSLLRIDRLRDKSLVHSDDIKALQRKMDDLSGLMGVEDRMRGLVQASKVRKCVQGPCTCIQVPSPFVVRLSAMDPSDARVSQTAGRVTRNIARLIKPIPSCCVCLFWNAILPALRS